jgi:hypothetical protein
MQYPEKLKEKFEDSKGVIRIVNRKKLPTQWQKDKRTNNDIQNIHIKLKIQ